MDDNQLQIKEINHEYPPAGGLLTQELFSQWIERRMNGNFIWLDERNQWMIWDKTAGLWHLKPPAPSNDCAPIMKIAQDTALWVLHHPPLNGLDLTKWASWAKQINTHSYQANSVTMIAERLHANPPLDIKNIISTPGRVYDLDTRSWRLPHKEDYATVSCIEIKEDICWHGSPWEIFINLITRGDTELAFWLQCFAGYCLLPFNAEPSVALLYGKTGGNGKSVFVNCISAVLGGGKNKSAYVTTVSVESVTSSGSDRIEEDYANLEGKRLAVAPETKTGQRLDTQRIKNLTGGDLMSVQFKYGHKFKIAPHARIIIYTNHLMRIPEDDGGIWRRVVNVPFLYTHPEDKRDPQFADKMIRDYSPAIAAWMWEGLQWVLSQPIVMMPPCHAVKIATANYKTGQCHALGFIETRCYKTEGAKVKAKDIFTAYKSWLEEEGLLNTRYLPRRKDFLDSLENAGFPARPSSHGNEIWVHGIQLISDDGLYGSLDLEPEIGATNV